MGKERVCRVFHGTDYVEIPFEQLTEGDMFKLYDDGIEVKNLDGCVTFLATSNPYMKNNIWSIDAEGINEYKEKTKEVGEENTGKKH